MSKSVFCLIIMLFLPVLIFAAGQGESGAVPPSVEGVVEYFDGDVTVDGVPADFGTSVPYGAVVKTGADAYCEIVFNSKNIFRITESTVVEIKLSVKNPEITVEQGAVAALFDKLDAFTGGNPFNIKTRTAVASVRGTAFFIKVESPESTYVCICNGKIDVAEPDGKRPAVYSSGHHKAVYYRTVDGRTEVTKAPMLYHSDEEMEAIAAHIDERIDWYY